jgi:hypothetical protein
MAELAATEAKALGHSLNLPSLEGPESACPTRPRDNYAFERGRQKQLSDLMESSFARHNCQFSSTRPRNQDRITGILKCLNHAKSPAPGGDYLFGRVIKT